MADGSRIIGLINIRQTLDSSHAVLISKVLRQLQNQSARIQLIMTINAVDFYLFPD